MDNVGIVVDDRPATIEFFQELGLELERTAGSGSRAFSRRP
jgi:catechol 2,3-dioxygenase-like lactoylglutathione lyase family enzyme